MTGRWLERIGLAVLLFVLAGFPLLAGTDAGPSCADHGPTGRAVLVATEGDLLTIGNIRGRLLNAPTVPRDERLFASGQAVIDPRLTDEVYFILKPFPPEWLFGHGYIVMTFKPGGFIGPRGEQSEGLVVSFEAYRYPNQTIDFIWKGTHKVYPNIAVVSTWVDYSMLECGVDGRKLHAYHLRLTPEQKVAFTRTAVLEGTRDRPDDYYNTLSSSCVTHQVEMINSVLPPSQRLKLKLLGNHVVNPKASFPTILPKAYMKLGVFDPAPVTIDRSNYIIPLGKLCPQTKK